MAEREKGVYESLNESIAKGIDEGRIDPASQAALIAAARKVARVMDEAEWPIIDRDKEGRAKLDNVSPSVFLKYCEALGIKPDLKAKPSGKSGLSKMRDGVKLMKVGA